MTLYRIEWNEAHAVELQFANENEAKEWWLKADLDKEAPDSLVTYFGRTVVEISDEAY